MKRKLLQLLLFVVGVINFLPVLGLLSVSQMVQAYGVDLMGHEIQIFMRHRALLFGLIGGLVFVSLLKPKLQTTAMMMAGISMVGFLLIMVMYDNINNQVMKIALIDVVGIACLMLAVLVKHMIKKDEI